MDCQNPPFSGQQAAATAICRIALLWPPSRVIHVIAVITAQGENMKSITEQAETAAPVVTTETKATKKATPGARRANVAPAKGKSGKKATPKKKAPRSAQNEAREGSKTATILEMLKRPGGASAKDLLKATGWQPHSLRGFLSGTVGKKMGLTVTSTKGEDRERSYSVKA
jgi:Protein of unknown function (DUF3489)